jgi:cobalt-precorrin 5A hydrolase
MDEKGCFAVSLLSGHLGGANELANRLAQATGARAVITTATDVNQTPAIDLIARQKGLVIQNPSAIKFVNMALVTGAPVLVHDPFALLTDLGTSLNPVAWDPVADPAPAGASVFVDDRLKDLGPATLVLRPPSLAVGMGCNRGTDMEEIKGLVEEVFGRFGLALQSIGKLASIAVKADEAAILSLAAHWNVDVVFFSRDELNGVSQVPNPSPTVEKHVGVKSVCEAAAILAASAGHLIVSKQKSPNATVAVARASFT